MAYTPTTWVNGVTAINATRMNNIETGVDTTDQALTDHLADTTDAHDASAISIADAGSYTAQTHVEDALQELYASRYALLYESVLGANTASIDTGAAGVAGGYDTLRIEIIARSTQAATVVGLLVRFNNDSGGNYDYCYTQNSNTTVTGVSTAADTEVDIAAPGSTADADLFSVWELVIPQYTAAIHKSGTFHGGFSGVTAGNNRIRAGTFRYRSTTAISRVSLFLGSDNLLAGSALRIYGSR